MHNSTDIVNNDRVSLRPVVTREPFSADHSALSGY